MSIIATNKTAQRDYFLQERFEAGIVLSGQEVKSTKKGNANLKGSYVVIRISKHGRPEANIINLHISPYDKAGELKKYDPTRTRRLLLKKSEMQTLLGKKSAQGLTIVPTQIYTKRSLIKIEIATARGKKKTDKREDIKRRESKRNIARSVKRY